MPRNAAAHSRAEQGALPAVNFPADRADMKAQHSGAGSGMPKKVQPAFTRPGRIFCEECTESGKLFRFIRNRPYLPARQQAFVGCGKDFRQDTATTENNKTGTRFNRQTVQLVPLRRAVQVKRHRAIPHIVQGHAITTSGSILQAERTELCNTQLLLRRLFVQLPVPAANATVIHIEHILS